MTAKTVTTSDSFIQAVATALDYFADPAWLGANSPLAAPYLLGHLLDPYETGETEQQRGLALRSALQRAASQLAADQQDLLRALYFERNPHLNNTGVALALNLPERTFYRAKNQAIQVLAQALNQTLLPPLRPETPVYQAMIGRTEVFRGCLAALHAGHSVYISGAGGTGKTTLGAAIVQAWQGASSIQKSDEGAERANAHQRTFWFTVRPSLNDYLASFLFALGYFLRSHGASHTWRQLVADRGKIHVEQLLGLIRYDLQTLQDIPLLFCVDEVDQLQPERAEHAQLLYLLEELRPITRLLLLGQRVVLEVSEYRTLGGFTAAEIDEYLGQRGLTQLSAGVRQQLEERTRGNPALLTLVMALYELGGDLEESLHSLEGAPSLEALFIRIWRRLSQAERQFLMQLAVFRSPSPADAWAEQDATVARLSERGLLQHDGHGGVSLLPHVRHLVYERTPAELRPALHLHAADIRAARGEIVAAMHHYLRARHPALAVWLWYENRTLEIERGRGRAALDLLLAISATDLANELDRNALHTARGQLLGYAGRLEEAESELNAVAVPGQGTFAAYVQQLRGSALEMQGRAEQALDNYRRALDSLSGTHQLREVTIHTRAGFLHEYHFQNRTEATKEALLARIKAEGFHGNIEEMAGNYAAARERYQAAFELAQQLGDLASLSRAYSQLGVLTLRLGDYEGAIPLIEQAIACDEQRGDVVSPLYDQLNLAYAHTLAGRYEKAYAIAHSGLEMAERLRHSYLIAGLAAGVGEACYGLERLAEAEHYARRSLAQEEGFFRCSALTVLGLVRSAAGAHTEAEQLLHEAIASAREAEDQHSEAYALHRLGEVLAAAGKQHAARTPLEAAIYLYRQLNLLDKVEEIQAVLASAVG